MNFQKKRLAELRKQKHWSQGDLQRILHEQTGVWVTRTAIAMWERGSVASPRAKYVAALAKVFDVQMESFFLPGRNKFEE